MGEGKLRVVPTARRLRYCSFCGRGEHEVDCMCTGPGEVAICDQCVQECVGIVAKKRGTQPTRAQP